MDFAYQLIKREFVILSTGITGIMKKKHVRHIIRHSVMQRQNLFRFGLQAPWICIIFIIN